MLNENMKKDKAREMSQNVTNAFFVNLGNFKLHMAHCNLMNLRYDYQVTI